MVLPGFAGTELGLFRVSPRFPYGRGTSQCHQALVAQLDRASASGAEGHRFESCRAHGAGPRGLPWALFYVSAVGVGSSGSSRVPAKPGETGGAQRSPSCRAHGQGLGVSPGPCSMCLPWESDPLVRAESRRFAAALELANLWPDRVSSLEESMIQLAHHVGISARWRCEQSQRPTG